MLNPVGVKRYEEKHTSSRKERWPEGTQGMSEDWLKRDYGDTKMMLGPRSVYYNGF